MKTATVRQLCHGFSSVLVWVEDGESVEISKRGTVICANFPPPRPKPVYAKKRPDFAARLKRIYREMVLPGSSVVEDREFRAYWISDKSNSSPAKTSEESLPFSSTQQCNS